MFKKALFFQTVIFMAFVIFSCNPSEEVDGILSESLSCESENVRSCRGFKYKQYVCNGNHFWELENNCSDFGMICKEENGTAMCAPIGAETSDIDSYPIDKENKDKASLYPDEEEPAPIKDENEVPDEEDISDEPANSSPDSDPEPLPEPIGSVDVTFGTDFILNGEKLGDTTYIINKYADENMEKGMKKGEAFSVTLYGKSVMNPAANTYSRAIHSSPDSGIYVQQMMYTPEEKLIYPISAVVFFTDSISPGLEKNYGIQIIGLTEISGKKTECLAALSNSTDAIELNILKAEKTTLDDGGTLEFTGTEIPLYYPSDLPIFQHQGAILCPRGEDISGVIEPLCDGTAIEYQPMCDSTTAGYKDYNCENFNMDGDFGGSGKITCNSSCQWDISSCDVTKPSYYGTISTVKFSTDTIFNPDPFCSTSCNTCNSCFENCQQQDEQCFSGCQNMEECSTCSNCSKEYEKSVVHTHAFLGDIIESESSVTVNAVYDKTEKTSSIVQSPMELSKQCNTFGETGCYYDENTCSQKNISGGKKCFVKVYSENPGGTFNTPSGPCMNDESKFCVLEEFIETTIAVGLDMIPESATAGDSLSVNRLGGAILYVSDINSQGESCIKAFGYGKVTIDDPTDMSSQSSPSLSVTGKDIKLYHPTDLPGEGDISSSLSIPICDK